MRLISTTYLNLQPGPSTLHQLHLSIPFPFFPHNIYFLYFSINQDPKHEKHTLLLDYIIAEGFHASTIYKGILGGQNYKVWYGTTLLKPVGPEAQDRRIVTENGKNHIEDGRSSVGRCRCSDHWSRDTAQRARSRGKI